MQSQGTYPASHIAGARAGVGWRRHADLLIAAGAVLLVAAPLLFTSSGFALDFTNHLWLSWVEGTGLAQAGHPSYFLHARGIGVFYPFFAFYGGSLYAIVGGISDLIGGHPVAAYVGMTTLAISGTYGGMVWLGRELGLRGLMIHAPALAVVTSAYYITNLYGRGAWTEFMAVAAIAPLLASGVHLVRAPAWRGGPVVVFVASAIVFSGSHNITLLWGTTVAAFAGVVLWLALGAPRRLPIRRLAMLGGLTLASLAANAWFLLPDISYSKDVAAHLEVAPNGAGVSFFDTPGLLFDPLRQVPAASTTPALFVQVPVWFLAWGLLAGGVLMWRRRDSSELLRRAWVGVVVLLAVILGMIMITPIWKAIPFPYDEIQFPYRLGSYAFYAVGGLVLAGALALQQAAGSSRSRRTVAWLRGALAVVCAISVALCVWQQWVPNTLFPSSYTNRWNVLRSVSTAPRTWYDPIAYTDVQAPIVTVPAGRVLVIPPESVRGDRFASWMNVPAGPAPILTNIAGGSYVAHISGVQRVGRSPYGMTVVRREGGGSGPVHVVVETTHSATIVLGRVLSISGCAAILAVLAWTAAGGRRGRRAVRARPRGRQARSS
ncbi:MAG TPA: hypothetical protein VK272_12310 [Solirubrobacteraceae bacterium]|nr:hypothetical protein [Solirubrobacteraceae bacterium]